MMIPGELPGLPEKRVLSSENPVVSASDEVLMHQANSTAERVSNVVNGHENNEEKRVIEAVRVFLISPERKSIAEIKDMILALGDVMETYLMDALEVPAEINTLAEKLDVLSREAHIAAAGTELANDEPNLMVILEHMRMASDNRSRLPVHIQQDLQLLQDEIDMRNIHSETYNRMCELSVVVTQAMEHIADQKTLGTAKALKSSLISGALPESIKTGMSLVPKLREDKGKFGAESAKDLPAFAEKIARMIEGLPNIS